MIKVNYGCGPVQPEGWINVDYDLKFDARYKVIEELEYMNGNVDIIVMHHVLQTIPYREQREILKRCYALLKPGGVLRISIPDILAAFDMYKKGMIDWFPKMDNEDIDFRFCHYLAWYNQNISPMTKNVVLKKLRSAGFEVALKTAYGETTSRYPESTKLDTRKNESIYMEARKNG